MTLFEQWFLKRIFRKEMRRPYYHGECVSNLYKMIREAYQYEFYEDNEFTTNSALREWFENTQYRNDNEKNG